MMVEVLFVINWVSCDNSTLGCNMTLQEVVSCPLQPGFSPNRREVVVIICSILMKYSQPGN